MNSATIYQTMFTSPVLVAIGSDREFSSLCKLSNKNTLDAFKQRVLSLVCNTIHMHIFDTMPISIERLLLKASSPYAGIYQCDGGKPSPQPLTDIICSMIYASQLYNSMDMLVREDGVLRAYKIQVANTTVFDGIKMTRGLKVKKELQSIPPLMQMYADAQHAKLLSKWLIPDIVKYIGSFLYVDPVSA